MVFPATPLVATVELNLGGTWTDITPFVKVKNGVTITRGRPDETSSTNPSSCKFTVKNLDGRFTPRNPTGAYYGLIGRNTPCRVSVNLGATRLFTGTSSLNYFSAPDTAGLSIVGDIDIRVDARFQSWRAPFTSLIGKTLGTTQRSYLLALNANGTLTLFWTVDGANYLSANSTMPVPTTSGRRAVRATLDVDNGAAGRTVTFYTAPSISGTWVQLGDPVVQPGTTSIFDSTAAAYVGIGGPEGYYYAAEIRQGIGGTVRANPDFTTQTSGATSFVDGAGNTWTKQGAAELTNKRQRFIGEISSWPTTWGLDQVDVVASVEAAGILRRLNQGDAPLRSAYYRAVTGSATDLLAYWPLEESERSTSFGSVTAKAPYGGYMAFDGAPTLASDSRFAAAEPLPVMNNAVFYAGIGIPSPDTGTAWHVRFLLGIPAAGATNGAVIARLYMASGNFADLIYGTGGTLAVTVYNSTGTLLSTTGSAAFGMDGVLRLVSMESSTTTTGVVTLAPGSNTGGFWNTGTGYGTSAPTALLLDPYHNLGATVIGHVYVQRGTATKDIFELAAALDAYAGDTAAARFTRLCAEQGVPKVIIGDPATTETMGAQLPKSFLELVGDAVDVDLAILSEPRESASLAFRARASISNQDPSLAVAYTSLTDLTPVDDDQRIRNDITVQRTGGSSSRQIQTTGALSTAAPPAGVGVYDDQVEINLEKDSDLADQASFRLRLGTIDEPRFPVINLDLATASFAASSSLTASALDLDQGDLLTVSGPPVWLPPDTIRQIAQGFTETFDLFSYEISVNCTPASAWDTGVYDAGSPASRYAADGATLSAGITSTATGAGALSIVTPAGKPLWTSAAGDFPMDINVAGERITLSAIAATASPQSATVSARSVNGVVKAQLAGASVNVADPIAYGL